MKISGLSTILLAFTTVILLISLVLIALVMYKLAWSTEYVIDSANKVTTVGLSAPEFWSENKMYLIAPTIINVLSMGLLAIHFAVV